MTQKPLPQGSSHPQWRRFASAYSLTISGDRFLDVLLPVISLGLTGDLSLPGIFLMGVALPRLFLTAVLLAWIQRRPQTSWCSIGNWTQSAGLALTALFLVLNMVPAVFLISAVLTGVGSALYEIAAQATIRNIVPVTERALANSLLEVIDSALTLGTPLIAGWLSLHTTSAVSILVAAFFYAGAAMLRQGLHPGAAAREEGSQSEPSGASFRTYLLTLWQPFVGRRRAWLTLALLTLTASSIALIPLAALRIAQLKGSAVEVGLALTAAGASGLVAAFIAGRSRRWVISERATHTVLILSIGLVCALLILPSVAAVIIAVALADGLMSWLYVSLPTLRMNQESSPALLIITGGLMPWLAVVSLLLGAVFAALSSPGFSSGAVVVLLLLGLVGSSLLYPRPLNSSERR